MALPKLTAVQKERFASMQRELKYLRMHPDRLPYRANWDHSIWSYTSKSDYEKAVSDLIDVVTKVEGNMMRTTGVHAESGAKISVTIETGAHKGCVRKVVGTKPRTELREVLVDGEEEVWGWVCEGEEGFKPGAQEPQATEEDVDAICATV